MVVLASNEIVLTPTCRLYLSVINIKTFAIVHIPFITRTCIPSLHYDLQVLDVETCTCMDRLTYQL